jgi:hypothetical protein
MKMNISHKTYFLKKNKYMFVIILQKEKLHITRLYYNAFMHKTKPETHLYIILQGPAGAPGPRGIQGSRGEAVIIFSLL